MSQPGLHVKPIHAFWLDSHDPSGGKSLDTSLIRNQRAILWLAGGGYVTGYPLNDRPIFSLAQNLPIGEYRILAPSITRALSLENSFPIPLLDAVAAYAHLPDQGFESENITIIGNSAGGGLAWSLMSYLVALAGGEISSLGVPSALVMISVSFV
jgi:acetyl esterase/lipase